MVTRLEDGTLLPGLIDLHFHIEDEPAMALRQLAHGVTAFRDPGEWMEVHEPLRRRIADEGLPGPRLFLTGPHIDGEGPAYPADSVVARDPEEARRQVQSRRRRRARPRSRSTSGCRWPARWRSSRRAKRAGVPSTAHLEILDARVLIEAGLTGVEHITSFGTSIASPMQAERYRQAVLADNGARRDGRYALFAEPPIWTARRRDAVRHRRAQRARSSTPPWRCSRRGRLTRWPKGSTMTAARRVDGFRKMQALVRRLHEQRRAHRDGRPHRGAACRPRRGAVA